jgi:hypothetical protein
LSERELTDDGVLAEWLAAQGQPFLDIRLQRVGDVMRHALSSPEPDTVEQAMPVGELAFSDRHAKWYKVNITI